MPDLSLHHALILAVLPVSIAGLVWISWRMDCRARRREDQRWAQEARDREAQNAPSRTMKRRSGARPLPGRCPPPPDFNYTPE